MKEQLPTDVFKITSIAPFAMDGSHLEKIWAMRNDLNQELIGRKKMIPIEFNRIHQPEYQNNVRQYMGFLVEELTEAMEQYIALYAFVVDKLNTEAVKCKLTLKSYNEEIADIIHIVLLIMDYSGISSFELEEYFENYASQLGIAAVWISSSPLQSFIALARHINGSMGRKYMKEHYKIEVKEDSGFYKGGQYVSNQLTITHKELVYDLIHYLMLASHELKNKPWKSKHVAVNIPQYHQYLLEVWIRLFIYLDFIQHDEKTIYEIFYKKNQVNLNRIANNY